MARGIRCQAHRHESAVAEENHHLQPQSRGGLTVRANMRYLCANAHGDVHYLLDLIEKHATPLIGRIDEPLWAYESIPWPVRRSYGPGVRDAALTGWMRYAPAFLRGEYRRHAALWSTNGQPASARGSGMMGGIDVSPLCSYGVAVASGQVAAMLRAVEL